MERVDVRAERILPVRVHAGAWILLFNDTDRGRDHHVVVNRGTTLRLRPRSGHHRTAQCPVRQRPGDGIEIPHGRVSRVLTADGRPALRCRYASPEIAESAPSRSSHCRAAHCFAHAGRRLPRSWEPSHPAGRRGPGPIGHSVPIATIRRIAFSRHGEFGISSGHEGAISDDTESPFQTGQSLNGSNIGLRAFEIPST